MGRLMLSRGQEMSNILCALLEDGNPQTRIVMICYNRIADA